MLMQSDPHRPIYHFVAPEGHAAPFDPNGAIYWKGKYHLGFVYQTHSRGDFFSNNGDYAWGHAVSTDLLHWTFYPNMLEVTNDRESGIYSGGAFLSKEGVPHLIYYTSATDSPVSATNNIAYATDDDLKVWKKSENNPVLRDEIPKKWKEEWKKKNWKGINPFLIPGRYSVFDPDAWYDKTADAYYQISSGARPALFKSRDMRTWSYLGDLIDKENTMRNPNEDLSCPDFFPIGNGKYMLLFISHNWGAQYYVGTFGNDKFTVERHARMNWPGGSFFAPEQLQDDKGRSIIWGWIVERKPQHLPDYGWSGIMSLPRVVSLGNDGRVRIDPAEELKAARVMQTKEEDNHLEPGRERTLRSKGRSLELKLEIVGAENDSVGIKVFASPDGREETIITYDPRRGELAIDFSKSSIRAPVTMPAATVFSWDGSDIAGFPKNVSEQRAPLKLSKGEPLKLNVFLDRSVIEVFANGIQCVTQVVYPELETSTGVKIFSGKEKVAVKNIQSWTMAETNAY